MSRIFESYYYKVICCDKKLAGLSNLSQICEFISGESFSFFLYLWLWLKQIISDRESPSVKVFNEMLSKLGARNIMQYFEMKSFQN